MFSCKYFPRNSLVLVSFFAVGWLRPLFLLNDRWSLRLYLYDGSVLWVDMLSRYILFPVNSSIVLFLSPPYYNLLILLPFSGIQKSIVQNYLFLLHFRSYCPILRLNELSLIKSWVECIKLIDEDFINLSSFFPGVQVLERLENAPVIPVCQNDYLTIK